MADQRIHHSIVRTSLLTISAVVAVLLWVYWTTFTEIVQRWSHDPQYAHGYLVPGFALILLWLRRGQLTSGEIRPSWWGLPIVLAAVALRLVGAYFNYIWLDEISLLPCLAGLFVLLGGQGAWRWAWPSILFLGFMIPLPYRVGVTLAGPLRHTATLASTFLLQTLGQPALSEGNIILLNEIKLDVVEACSGLRMLVIFFALSTAVALIIRRPLWERVLVALSAVPIALIANITRITVTGLLQEAGGTAMARAVFHDLAGWLMMPVALVLLWTELALLARLFIEPAAPDVIPRRLRSEPATPRTRWNGSRRTARTAGEVS